MTIVLAIVDDMFFASKIRGTAEAVGVEVKFFRSMEKLIENAREAKPALVVVDLHNTKLDSVALATELKVNEDLRAIQLLGFFSHVHADLQRNAVAAGLRSSRSAIRVCARPCARSLATAQP